MTARRQRPARGVALISCDVTVTAILQCQLRASRVENRRLRQALKRIVEDRRLGPDGLRATADAALRGGGK